MNAASVALAARGRARGRARDARRSAKLRVARADGATAQMRSLVGRALAPVIASVLPAAEIARRGRARRVVEPGARCRRARAARRVHGRARARAGAPRAVPVLRRRAPRRAGRAVRRSFATACSAALAVLAIGDPAGRDAWRRPIVVVRRARRGRRCVAVRARPLSACAVDAGQRAAEPVAHDDAEVHAGGRRDGGHAGFGEGDDPRDAAEADEEARAWPRRAARPRARPGPGPSPPARRSAAGESRGATSPSNEPVERVAGRARRARRRRRTTPSTGMTQGWRNTNAPSVTTATAPCTARSARASTGSDPEATPRTLSRSSRQVARTAVDRCQPRAVDYSRKCEIRLLCVFELAREMEGDVRQ